jgi:hypothetical protein
MAKGGNTLSTILSMSRGLYKLQLVKLPYENNSDS